MSSETRSSRMLQSAVHIVPSSRIAIEGYVEVHASESYRARSCGCGRKDDEVVSSVGRRELGCTTTLGCTAHRGKALVFSCSSLCPYLSTSISADGRSESVLCPGRPGTFEGDPCKARDRHTPRRRAPSHMHLIAQTHVCPTQQNFAAIFPAQGSADNDHVLIPVPKRRRPHQLE